MRYENNPILREYLHRGAYGAYREHLRHPGFELDATAFAETLTAVRAQHPHLGSDEAEARAVFRLLTSGAPPEIAVALPSRCYRARVWTLRAAPRLWPWVKLAWALAVLALLVLLALGGLAAHAEPIPQPSPGPVPEPNAQYTRNLLAIAMSRPLAQIGGVQPVNVVLIGGVQPSMTDSSLNVNCTGGCSGGGGDGSGASLADEGAFAEGTTVFAPSGGYYKSSITALTSGQGGAVALTANRAFHVTNYSAAGAEIFTSGNAGYVQFASTPTVTVGNSSLAVTGTFWQTTQPVSQSGTWTIQPGNTANTTPWLFTINQGGNSAAVTGANALKVDGSAVTQPVSGTFWQSTQPVSLASLPSLAAGSNSIGTVVLGAGSAAIGSVNATLQASSGTDIGKLDANQSVNLSQVGGNSVVTGGVNGSEGVGGLASDGSSASGNPVLIAGKGSGDARVPVVCDNITVINQASTSTATIISGTAGQNVHFCSINLVVAAAENVNIVEGTGTNCGTSISASVFGGGTTAASGWNFAANGGLAYGTGIGVIAQTATAADNVCIMSSGSSQISGVVSWTKF